MLKVKVLIYERFRNQLQVFLQSFKKVNVSKDINYEFIIVSASVKPDDIDGCICEELFPYDGNYRLSFLKKIDDLLETDTDIIIIADDRCFCRESIDQQLLVLNDRQGWQLFGSVVDPMFDINLINDSFSILRTEFVYLNGAFLILNCKNIPRNLTDLAKDVLPSDEQLYTDRTVLNVVCDQKIASNRLLCDNLFNTYRFDYKVVLFDIYRTDTDHTEDSFDETFIFLKEYYQETDDKNLRSRIKKLLAQTPPTEFLRRIICERLIQKQYLYNKYDSIDFNKN